VSDEELRSLHPHVREEYLRNRFRSYMNRFQFYKSNDSKLELNFELADNKINLSEGKKSEL